jgi:hypothetical protein
MGGVINFMPAYVPASGINVAASNTQIPMFLCPSDNGVQGGPSAQNNYAANQGGWLCDRSDNPGLPTDTSPGEVQTGVFYFLSHVRFADITDGASNTAIFSEKIRGNGNPNPISDLFVIPNQTTFIGTYQTCMSINPLTATPLTSKWGFSWVMGENCCTQYNHVAVPNSPSCAGTGFSGTMTNMAMQVSANSRHAGGVHTLAGDGAVHFVSSNVDLGVWRAYGTRASGEIDSNPF